MRRFLWINQLGPKCHNKCSYKREAEVDSIYRRKRNVKTEQREIWPQAKERMTVTRNWKRLGPDFLLEFPEGVQT